VTGNDCQRLSDETLLDVPTRARDRSVEARDLLRGGSAEGVVAAQRTCSSVVGELVSISERARVSVTSDVECIVAAQRVFSGAVSNTSVKHRRGITRPECTLSDRVSVRTCS
jgi:hypothetical protein